VALDTRSQARLSLLIRCCNASVGGSHVCVVLELELQKDRPLTGVFEPVDAQSRLRGTRAPRSHNGTKLVVATGLLEIITDEELEI
jgi:hypothetical protein